MPLPLAHQAMISRSQVSITVQHLNSRRIVFRYGTGYENIYPRASCGRARGGIDVNEVYRTIGRSGTAQISPAQTRRVHGPKHSGNRRVWPVALHLRIKADSAARTRGDSRPEPQLAGAARTSGACQRNVQKRPNNRSEEPEIEQKRAEHPQTLKNAQGVLGIEADEHSGQENHQEPADAVSNLQLQLEVLPHTHVSIVLASTLIRSRRIPATSCPGDMSVLSYGGMRSPLRACIG